MPQYSHECLFGASGVRLRCIALILGVCGTSEFRLRVSQAIAIFTAMTKPARKQILAIEFPRLEAPSPVYLKLGPREISLWFRDQEGYTFDGEGRPFAAFRQQRRFRRALDGRLIVTAWGKGTSSQRARQVTLYERPQAEAELRQWRARLQPLLAEITSGRYRAQVLHRPSASTPNADELRVVLAKILAWDGRALAQDIDHYFLVYHPVAILPPDQYLALYLQMTIGCSYNRCVFCEFYRDRPYRVRSEQEFLAHLEAVEQYFGAAITMRRRLFLGDANALYMDANDLRQHFQSLNRRYDIGDSETSQDKLRFDGIYSFVDSFTGSKLSETLLRDLAALGLRRVYLGFETGNEELRRMLHKPGNTDQVIATAQLFKHAGINVGIILLVGIGGLKMASAHVTDSVRALAAMALDKNDLIFLSDLVVAPDSKYLAVAAAHQWRVFSADELLPQRMSFIRAIRQQPSFSKVKIANYDIREFVY